MILTLWRDNNTLENRGYANPAHTPVMFRFVTGWICNVVQIVGGNVPPKIGEWDRHLMIKSVRVSISE